MVCSLSFLYKAVGTSLTACQDLVHVKSQIHTFLKTTDYMEAPERQGVISILAVCAESHLDLTLKAFQEFGAAMSKVKISGFISRLKDYHHGTRGKTRRTLMLTYSNVAVHALEEQLLSRVEADITGNVLHHYRTSCQTLLVAVLHFVFWGLGITVTNKDMHLKLTLIQNVTEISCAILETRDSQEFEFSYKLELLGYMLMTSLKGTTGFPGISSSLQGNSCHWTSEQTQTIFDLGGKPVSSLISVSKVYFPFLPRRK
ncbi:unnamed protein product [Caretta caretta]